MITAIDQNTALVLIDLQKGIIARLPENISKPVIENAAKLVAAFRNENLPVVIVHVNPAGAAWLKTRKQVNMPQTALPADFTDIVPGLTIESGDIVITKHTWNAFFETALHEKLQQLNVTGIVLGGVSTSVGVEGTARNASEHGYNIIFAEDAMNDNIPEAHAHSLKNIFPRIGEIGSTEEIIAKLAGR